MVSDMLPASATTLGTGGAPAIGITVVVSVRWHVELRS
jgi:hypothetical protein